MSYILALPNVHCYKRKFCIVFFRVYHHGYIDCKQNWVLYKEFKNKWLYALSHTLNVSIFIFLSTCLLYFKCLLRVQGGGKVMIS